MQRRFTRYKSCSSVNNDYATTKTYCWWISQLSDELRGNPSTALSDKWQKCKIYFYAEGILFASRNRRMPQGQTFRLGFALYTSGLNGRKEYILYNSSSYRSLLLKNRNSSIKRGRVTNCHQFLVYNKQTDPNKPCKYAILLWKPWSRKIQF